MTTITMAFNYLNALGIDKALIDEQALGLCMYCQTKNNLN